MAIPASMCYRITRVVATNRGTNGARVAGAYPRRRTFLSQGRFAFVRGNDSLRASSSFLRHSSALSFLPQSS